MVYRSEYMKGGEMTKTLMKPKGWLLKHLIRDSYHELQMRYENNDRDHESLTIESVEIKVSSVFNFFEKGGLYVLSGATPQDNRNHLTLMTIANIADNPLKRNMLIFLRKMDAQAWVMKLLSYASGIPMGKMRTGAFACEDWRSLAQTTGDLAQLGVMLYEGEYILNDFVDYCRAQYQDGDDFDVVVIDGLTPQETNDLNDGGEVHQSLSALAKDFQVSIVASSLTYTGKKKPMLERLF